MLILAILLFLAAVACGLFLLTAILQDRPINITVRNLHAVFAALGLLIIIVHMLAFATGKSTLLAVSLILLIVAALGGFSMVALAKKGKQLPKMGVLVHPIIALAGLIALVIYVLP
ncbi:hypothetical protein [Fluoribacter gormanii]|uniref:Invasion gene expression up-regulator, SirB n=1 Tax=Fluoribacter gormanii TaxID=464 RepID=A0A377GGV3_9GAMM|nr:hypothetical protein [Fluoribacter gormanii]KTD02235.1 hypothetical protein Lgor_1991 [Fluoribacter gormanii]MCW8444423.1 hypothetical protein [Fluoribacter gormanii]SIR25877.1 hypothetical protein SAMN05421777_10921 [Fluoribacter gormanii]STO24057.1 Uncharacterised protein [Fluoribacter gormanii]